MNTFAYLFAIATAAMALYFIAIRSWSLTWGATNEEAACPLPGDEIVLHPHFIATRAVTINAAPSDVWRWIIQIGSARAGTAWIGLTIPERKAYM